MNPVFVFLIILAAIFVWLMCAGLFKHIGSVFGEMMEDVKDSMDLEKGKESQ